MEELKTDYSQAAAYYAGMGSGGLINHRCENLSFYPDWSLIFCSPGPVYTITEEDEGERVIDGDAKSVGK